MDGEISRQASMYICTCQKIYIDQADLLEHLKLPLSHRICKVDPEKKSFYQFNKLILRKIDSITEVQAELQKSSVVLTQTIVNNTVLAFDKLHQLIRIYRKILLDPPRNLEVQNTEFVSTICIHKSLNQAMLDHFNQRIAVERFTVDEKIENIKSKVSELFKKRSGSFLCMAMLNSKDFIITGGYDGFIRVWRVKHRTQSYILKKHKDSVWSIAIDSVDNIMLSGSHDCSVRLWDINTMKHLHHFKGHSYPVYSVLIAKKK